MWIALGNVRNVRWEEVAADLAGQMDDQQVADTEDEIEERLVAERARIRLIDRLAAAAGRDVGMRVTGADWTRGTVVEVGPDWCLLRGSGSANAETLVALGAVTQVTGLGDGARDPALESTVAARYGLRSALRRLVAGGEISLALLDGTRLRGEVTAVGADTLDVRRGSDPETICCPIGQVGLLSWS